MICKNCKKENIDGRKYCFYCGSDLTQVKEVVQNVPTSNNLNEDNDKGFEETKNRSKESKRTINGKWIAVISIASVAIISLAIAIIVVSIPKSNYSVSHPGGETTANSLLEDYEMETKQLETIKVPAYTNINNKSAELDENTLDELQSVLSDKSKDLNMNIKLIVDNISSGNVQKYADNNCEIECGSDGILFVIDNNSKSFAISSTGSGDDYLPKNLKEKITKEAKSNFPYMDFIELLSFAVNSIPNDKDVAKLYTFDRIDGSYQVVYADSKKSKLTLLDWSEEFPEKLFETNTVYFGMDGITDSPSEYKSATPRGEFKLGFAFSNRYLNTKLDTLEVVPGMVWVDDPNSDYYNTVQYGSTNNPPKWSSAEDTYAIFDYGTNYACVLIEHNGDGYTKGINGKGSAMYLAGKNTNLTTSYGDVNISAEDMKSLLSYLDENKNPYIVIN